MMLRCHRKCKEEDEFMVIMMVMVEISFIQIMNDDDVGKTNNKDLLLLFPPHLRKMLCWRKAEICVTTSFSFS